MMRAHASIFSIAWLVVAGFIANGVALGQGATQPTAPTTPAETARSAPSAATPAPTPSAAVATSPAAAPAASGTPAAPPAAPAAAPTSAAPAPAPVAPAAVQATPSADVSDLIPSPYATDTRLRDTSRIVAPVEHHGDAGAPFAVAATIEAPWYTDPSYDVFGKHDVGTRFGLWAAYDFAQLRSDTILAVEVGWDTEHAQDDALLGGRLHSDLATQVFHGGFQLRWVPVAWLQPHLRLVGGAARVTMELAAQSPSQTFKDHGVSPFGSLGLGFTLRSPSRLFEDKNGRLAALSVGLMFEGGYSLAAPLDFTLDGPSQSARDIAIVDAKAGRLERSGPYFRVSLVVRF